MLAPVILQDARSLHLYHPSAPEPDEYLLSTDDILISIICTVRKDLGGALKQEICMHSAAKVKRMSCSACLIITRIFGCQNSCDNSTVCLIPISNSSFASKLETK